MNVAVAAIIERDGEILLVHQQGSDDPEASWALPGGVVEDDEDLFTALAREVEEETGLHIISVDHLAFSAAFDESDLGKWIAFTFHVTVADGDTAPADPDDLIIDCCYQSTREALRLIQNELPWRMMREPLLAYILGDALPGSMWFYRHVDGSDELLQQLSPKGR